ncbi:hypothetical protein L0Y65_03955 [Candidatus Micrarchaeota archaeon]|nr:hypothetical protein [Candidatus Micrarchaeota archaeon]
MRGYISFVLVFLCAILLLSAIPLLSQARSYDLSDAVLIERAYGLQMNAKECALEAVRQGAVAGFAGYDLSHDLGSCIHCADHFCAPPTPADPSPPNICDPARCRRCFREKEARNAAGAGAAQGLSRIRVQAYGDAAAEYGDLGPDCLMAYLVPDAWAKSGLRVGSVRFCDDLPVRVRLEDGGVSISGNIPKGTVVHHGPGGD